MPITYTTTLPGEDQPTLGNGVEDEVAVDRQSAPTNYGDVRIQIRETGESSWDATAEGFGEFIGAYDTTEMEFVGREDGERYEVRARTETEHVTGAWTDPVAITTKFPAVVNLVVTAVDETTVEGTWTDRADNEQGQEVIRERRGPDGDWWPERLVEDVGPNSETFVDDTAQADREYRYRIRAYTEHASAKSNTDTASTPALEGVRSVRVPTSGPYVEVETPDREAPLRPTVTDYDWSPDVKERPSVEITVPKSDRWDELKGQPMWVWLDGTQLPIDTLEGTRTVTGDGGSRTVLEGTGASQLDEYTDDIQYDEKENHLAGEELIDVHTEYASNVDDPATDTRSDVLMLARSGSSLEDDLLDPVAPSDPIEVTQIDGISRLQTGWFVEAEDTDTTAVTYFADQEGNDGAWSGNQAIRLEAPGDGYEFTFRNDHEIPAGQLQFSQLEAVINGGNPAFDIEVDDEVVASFPENSLGETANKFDLDWRNVSDLNPDSALEPGLHTISISVTASGSDSLYIDCVHVADDRDSFLFDETPQDEIIQGPGEYPGTVDVVFDDIASVEQVIAGAISVQMSNTESGQAVAISNDEGDNWIEAQNAESVSGEFAAATQQIRARVTLSGYSADPTTSPAQNDAGQSVDEIELGADLEDTPVLFDKQYRDRLENVLSLIADDGRMVWEARRDPDADPYDPTGIIIEWTQIGQRTRDSAAPATSLEKRTTIEDAYDRVVVFGRSKGVEGVTWSQGTNSTLTGLGNAWIVPDSERIYNPDTDEVFDRGDDYRMEWDVGGIEILDGGSMSTGTTYAADYEFRYRGEATTPTVDPSEARTVERKIPGATSDRECDQLALSILKDVQEAQVEATLTLVEPAPDVPLVEAISHPRLPEGAQEIRGVERSSTSEREYRLANRRTAGEIVDALRDDYESLADVV